MKENRNIEWSRLTSLAVGLGMTGVSLMVGIKVGAIPSFFASIVGMGGLVQFSCGLVGAAGGAAGYLYGAKQMQCWPMYKPPKPEPSMLSKAIWGVEEESAYDEYKSALLKIEDELRFCAQKPQREQIIQESYGRLLQLYQHAAQLKQTLGQIATFTQTTPHEGPKHK